MAESLIKSATRIGLALGLCSVLSSVAAQALTDPTQPPAGLAAMGVNDAVPSGPALQSVLIGPGRRVAIISGQTVKVGEKFGDATVTRITESSVVLRNGNELQTLKLFPGVEKQPVAGASHAKAGRRRP